MKREKEIALFRIIQQSVFNNDILSNMYYCKRMLCPRLGDCPKIFKSLTYNHTIFGVACG